MSRFLIKAIDSKGGSHEETIEAADQHSLYGDLKQRSLTLVSVNEVVDHPTTSRFNIVLFGKVKMADRITFARNLGSMIDAGLSMSRALTVLEKQTKQQKFKGIIADLGRSISQGRTLSDAMKQYPEAFPPLMSSMVKAGEESGSLSQSLHSIATQMESSYALTRKVRGALMYPMVILGVMFVIGFFMMTYVVPILSATFKEMNADLPIQTKIVIGVSDFLKGNLIVTIVGIVVVIAGAYFGSKTKPGKRILDWVMLRLPVVGFMVKEVNSARTTRTLSSLLTAGVDVVVATRITADVVQNSYYKEVLAIVEEKIQKGDPIASVFAAREDLYPIFVSEMISVGEETGQLAQMLLGVATFYEDDVDQKTKDMSSVIEPVLMVVIGLAVGFFAISIIGPIYSIGNNL
jgi:type IV pilus assembly protein PilC